MLCDTCKLKTICKIGEWMAVEGILAMAEVTNKLKDLHCDDICSLSFHCDIFKEVKDER